MRCSDTFRVEMEWNISDDNSSVWLRPVSPRSGAVLWRAGVSGVRASVWDVLCWSMGRLELWGAGGQQGLCAGVSVSRRTGSGRSGSVCAGGHVSLQTCRRAPSRREHRTQGLQPLVGNHSHSCGVVPKPVETRGR